MRFTENGFDLFRIMRLNSQRLLRVVTMPLLDGYRRMRRYLNPNGFSTKVIGDVRKSFRGAISAKPSSLKDYVAFSRYYVAKKLLFIIALLIIVLPILYIKFLHPTVQAKFFTKTMYVNSMEMSGYSGQVKLLSPSTDQVLYQGPLVNGRVTGQGLLWDQEGHLVYQGDFLMEMYDGEGELFYPNGQTRYKGAFAKNSFEGAGYYYREDSLLQYEGGFVGGLYEGRGKEYFENGVLRYEGDFVKGKYEGAGVLYDSVGQLVFNGEFKDGKHEGQGILYENGEILYEGQLAGGRLNGEGKIYSGEMVLFEGAFKEGQFEGNGKAYDPVTGHLIYEGAFAGGQYNGQGKLFEPQKGNLLYSGEFYNGAYEGQGKLFDADSGFPVYIGGFRLGRFDGQGTLYDIDSGLIQYDGGYLLDNFSGQGTLYDTTTGLVQVEGIFKAGQLLAALDPVLPDDGEFLDIPGDGGTGTGTGTDTGTGSGSGTDSGSGAGSGSETGNGGQDDQSKVYYSGPQTEDGAVDYQALAIMDAQAAQEAFSQTGLDWDLEAGKSLVYEDVKENLGLTLQMNPSGELIGLDVWNDAPVQNIQIGMTREEIETVLGAPVSEVQETMGEPRMVSISQSNRFHNRITNISADSQVTILRYTSAADGSDLQVVFVRGIDQCLLIEVRPK